MLQHTENMEWGKKGNSILYKPVMYGLFDCWEEFGHTHNCFTNCYNSVTLCTKMIYLTTRFFEEVPEISLTFILNICLLQYLNSSATRLKPHAYCYWSCTYSAYSQAFLHKQSMTLNNWHIVFQVYKSFQITYNSVHFLTHNLMFFFN